MLKFLRPDSQVFVPGGTEPESALARTTLLGVGAHQDDLEVMAYYPILAAFRTPDESFTGVTVTNGGGCARSGIYASLSDAEMMEVRCREQRTAAMIGRYEAMIQLCHPSTSVKAPDGSAVVDDLEHIVRSARPREVFTHNLADKHDTHVGVALKLVHAIRRLPFADRPEKLIGCEVWRDLDWLHDPDKVVMKVDGNDNLADSLIGVFDSQIAGGKRYDIATRGRRRAHATYFESHTVDGAENVIFGMDLTPLIVDDAIDAEALFGRYLEAFRCDVVSRIRRLSGS